MLQFTVSLTAYKQLPEVDNNIETITAANVDRISEKENTAFSDVREDSSPPSENQTVKTGNGKADSNSLLSEYLNHSVL